jgi:hypothetical protein
MPENDYAKNFSTYANAEIREVSPPFIVYGLGRSGTSFVCSILHQQFGVSMGLKFNGPNKHSPIEPYGSYECKVINAIFYMFIYGKKTFPQFMERFSQYCYKQSENNKFWGFKCVGGYIPHAYFFLPTPRLIITYRDYDKILESMQRTLPEMDRILNRPYRTPEDLARMFPYKKQRYDNVVQATMGNHFVVSFDEPVDREALARRMMDAWPELEPYYIPEGRGGS